MWWHGNSTTIVAPMQFYLHQYDEAFIFNDNPDLCTFVNWLACTFSWVFPPMFCCCFFIRFCFVVNVDNLDCTCNIKCYAYMILEINSYQKHFKLPGMHFFPIFFTKIVKWKYIDLKFNWRKQKCWHDHIWPDTPLSSAAIPSPFQLWYLWWLFGPSII